MLLRQTQPVEPIMKITKSQPIATSQQITQGQQDAVSLFEKFAGLLAAKLPKKTQPFFLSLLLGALLAIARRRTAAQWIKAAQRCENYQQIFYHIPNIGCIGWGSAEFRVQNAECLLFTLHSALCTLHSALIQSVWCRNLRGLASPSK